MRRNFVVAILGMLLIASGCKTSPQQVEPAQRGARGESCNARNDCADGLACISHVCSKNDFDISVTAKQCDRIDCSVDKDCCGDTPLTAPAKCADRVTTCETPNVVNCTSFSTCSQDSECGDGTCSGNGICSLTGGGCSNDSSCYSSDVCSGGFCTTTSLSCNTDAECYGADMCDAASGTCTVTGVYCADDSDCYGSDVCTNKTCDCTNPDYNPSAPICFDTDCDDVCTLRCDNELCVPDDTCKTDTDCAFSINDICSSGHCVECETKSDCASGESCVNGSCMVGCKQDEECPLFHACEKGECVESGCKSDRECVLAAAGGGLSSSVEDARLSKCLDSDNPSDDFKVCKIPCENDGACGEFSVCESGFCKFIGCESDDDCRALLDLENEQVTSGKPYVSQAVCRP